MRWLVAMLAVCALSGCPRKFRIETPSELVALEEPGGDAAYAYRATSADGVVLSVRDIRNEPEGDLAFWADAVRAQLRLGKGYALLDEAKVRARSGEAGLRMRFGREEHGKPYRYVVALFVTDRHVFVLEAGGRKARFEARNESIDRALDSFRIRGIGTATSD